MRAVRQLRTPAADRRRTAGIDAGREVLLDDDDVDIHYQYRFAMIVCLCRGVSDRTVRLVVAQGAATPDAVAARCGAGGDCGGCRAMVEDLIEEGSGIGAAASGSSVCSGEDACDVRVAAAG